MDLLLSIRDDVAEALSNGRPVVALESTVIAHGLPRPQNLDTARRMEAVVRETGAVPAIIAVFEGKLVAGISPEQLVYLAETEGIAKVSRADLASVLASGRAGATTVAGSILAANRAGIRVFATGGIGGVHRGWQTSLDVSADLFELARTPVATVCAGAKAILDLPCTIEMLETLGVPVVGYGTNEFPAFFVASSGLPLNARVDTPEEAARLIAAHENLGLKSSVLFCNPPPATSALDRKELEAMIEEALGSAAKAGIRGKPVTPYLLEFLANRSGGRTLQANVALLENNARIAAKIAVALAKLRAV
ncbi:MAG: pseudouridine-5'-phosphate glycosidase [Candidatus Acidiferrales bacterium]